MIPKVFNLLDTDTNYSGSLVQNFSVQGADDAGVEITFEMHVVSKKGAAYPSFNDAISAMRGQNIICGDVHVNVVDVAGTTKVLISMRNGDILTIPEGIDIDLDALCVHLEDGTTVSCPYGIFVID